MTMTTHAVPRTRLDRTDHRTAAGLVGLVAGAVLLALGRILATPGGSPGDRLHQMTGHDLQVTAAALLAIAGFTALVPGFWTVAAHVRRRGRLLATVGAGLVLAGSVGFSVLTAVDLSTLASTHVSDPGPMRAFLHQLDVSPGILALTVPAVLGYFCGPFLVTLAARRAGFVPRWLPWAVVASLVVQPLGAALGGPALARVVDTVCQLLLVTVVTVLAAATRRAHADVT